MVPIKDWKENEALKWDPSLELGHGAIDAEHCALHKLIVDFQEAALQGAPKENLAHLLEEITGYAKFHFASEEKIMANNQYPGLAGHAVLHGALLAEIRDKHERFQRGEIEAAQVYVFLLNWFAFHTSHEDKKLVRYMNR